MTVLLHGRAAATVCQCRPVEDLCHDLARPNACRMTPPRPRVASEGGPLWPAASDQGGFIEYCCRRNGHRRGVWCRIKRGVGRRAAPLGVDRHARGAAAAERAVADRLGHRARAVSGGTRVGAAIAHARHCGLLRRLRRLDRVCRRERCRRRKRLRFPLKSRTTLVDSSTLHPPERPGSRTPAARGGRPHASRPAPVRPVAGSCDPVG